MSKVVHLSMTRYSNINGNKSWYLNGKLHREDGPAVEYANGDKFWYLHGRIHREDGPAIEFANGDKYWYINDLGYTFNNWIKLVNISLEGKTLLILRYK